MSDNENIVTRVGNWINKHDKIVAGMAVAGFWGSLVAPGLSASYQAGASMGQLAMQAGSSIVIPVGITTAVGAAVYGAVKAWQKGKEFISSIFVKRKEKEVSTQEKPRLVVLEEKDKEKETQNLLKVGKEPLKFEKFSMKAFPVKEGSLKTKLDKSFVNTNEISK